MLAREVLIRLALILGAAALNLDSGGSPWITGIIGLIAIAATVELAIRPHAAGVFDRLLLMAGSLIVALILIGLLLNLTHPGLTRGTWNIAWALASIVVLIRRRALRTRVSLPRVPVNALSVSVVAAVIIIAGATALVASGVQHWERTPVLSFSLLTVNSSAVTTQVNATSVSGTYRIVVSLQGHKGAIYTGKPFQVIADGSGTTLQEQIPVREKGRWVIDLEPASGSTGSRELIADVP